MSNDIRRLAERQAAIDSRDLPKAATKREPSHGEAMREAKPIGYRLHYCFHERSYYEVCTKCRRSRVDAMRNLSRL